RTHEGDRRAARHSARRERRHDRRGASATAYSGGARSMIDIRVLIAEDQTLMRQGLRTILDLNHGFIVVGEAENGRAAIERALALRPDVVLMDVQMPEINGVAATGQI